MKNIILIFSVLSVALIFLSCSKKNDTSPNAANIMFVNGCNGSVNIDTKVNGSKISSASNLAYLSNSGYQNVTPGTGAGISFYLTAQGTPLVSGTTNLSVGSHYSVFAGGIITAPAMVVTSDDITAPASGNAKVRFINLSSDTLNENLYVGSQKLDSNIAYSASTPFFEVAAGTAAVLAQDPLKPTKIAQLSSQTFAAGKIYTIMLNGTSNASSSGAALTLTVINNN